MCGISPKHLLRIVYLYHRNCSKNYCVTHTPVQFITYNVLCKKLQQCSELSDLMPYEAKAVRRKM